MKMDTGQDTVTSHCHRVEYIYIIEPGGRVERLDHGISYGICVESERLGIPVKDLIRERMAPKLEDIRIKYWY